MCSYNSAEFLIKYLMLIAVVVPQFEHSVWLSKLASQHQKSPIYDAERDVLQQLHKNKTAKIMVMIATGMMTRIMAYTELVLPQSVLLSFFTTLKKS